MDRVRSKPIRSTSSSTAPISLSAVTDRAPHKKEQRARSTKSNAPKRRRLILFGVLAAALLYWAGSEWSSQQAQLSEINASLHEARAELADVQDMNVQLRLEVQRLNDPDYIAQIARKDYYYTDTNEILFKID